ncbi:MAG TPA: tRNA (adenosine(37)-N6)-dimethylallyltransferase MiaA [Prosthecobacter sp.]|nr:tRNA (adenosine(37)-N6)-dimethylallyltransferase MiaA [Prosthecobacter sp.]
MNPFFIIGPTASGKSAAALALAERTGGEIVNADAFQLYQGMDLLTAKPSKADRSRVRHHLYDVLPLTENCDAQRYREMAVRVIEDIEARGRLAIVVGGSGLYIKALSHGLAEVPRADPRVRARLSHLSLGEKVAWLLLRDVRAAETVALRNPRYVERALEICLLTGRPQSELRQSFETTPPQGQGVVLQWDREILYQRINQRVLDMMTEGLLDEVCSLRQGGANAEKAIGLREMRAHLAGNMTLKEAVAAMQTATRQYAKRQTTWFKRERWLQTICLDSEAAAESVANQILDLFPCLLPSRPPKRTRSRSLLV